MATETTAIIHVEVAYARPDRQLIVPLEVPAGTTVAQAAERSGIAAHFEDLDLARADFGIFGTRASAEQTLRNGDRVEIYRPLLADPKEVRRELAKLGKSMGRRRRGDQADGGE